METVETLNKRLIEYYGIDTATGDPIFRIVWSNDQTEKRMMDTLDSGIQLLSPVLREVKKYSYIKDAYILERLSVIPDSDRKELGDLKLSYEPIWTYMNDKGESVPPIWPATQFIVDTLFAALGKKSLHKYVDSEENTTPEGREHRIEKLQDELFGNETETADALRYREGITVPSNYKVN